jgi:hypothetical protein
MFLLHQAARAGNGFSSSFYQEVSLILSTKAIRYTERRGTFMDVEKYDAKFHAFQEIVKLVEILIPKDYQLTLTQVKAIHACAKKLATDLTSGVYENGR